MQEGKNPEINNITDSSFFDLFLNIRSASIRALLSFILTAMARHVYGSSDAGKQILCEKKRLSVV
jgi:hypothetical protein